MKLYDHKIYKEQKEIKYNSICQGKLIWNSWLFPLLPPGTMSSNYTIDWNRIMNVHIESRAEFWQSGKPCFESKSISYINFPKLTNNHTTIETYLTLHTLTSMCAITINCNDTYDIFHFNKQKDTLTVLIWQATDKHKIHDKINRITWYLKLSWIHFKEWVKRCQSMAKNLAS